MVCSKSIHSSVKWIKVWIAGAIFNGVSSQQVGELGSDQPKTARPTVLSGYARRRVLRIQSDGLLLGLRYLFQLLPSSVRFKIPSRCLRPWHGLGLRRLRLWYFLLGRPSGWLADLSGLLFLCPHRSRQHPWRQLSSKLVRQQLWPWQQSAHPSGELVYHLWWTRHGNRQSVTPGIGIRASGSP